MEKLYGYAGKLLRINLSNEQIDIVDEEEASLRKYLGGVGLGSKVLYDEVPPEVQWSDPENCIILTSGPLSGTRVMGSGSFSAVTKGALTNGSAASQANGYLGAYLKFSGFDGVIIRGCAEHLKYIYIHDRKVEFKDARHLAGRDTWETEVLIKKELGLSPKAASVFSIGPAGENLVRFAGLVGDRGHAAPHNGLGAVMGSKNLKAIAVVRGKCTVEVSNGNELLYLRKQMFDVIRNDPIWNKIYHWGMLWGVEGLMTEGKVPFKNYTTNISPMNKQQLKTFSPQYLREYFSRTSLTPHPCWACQMHHCHLIKIPSGPYAGCDGEEPEYEGYAAMGTQLGIWDGIAVTSLCNEVDRLGLDINETGWLIGMVMESYEKGILTDDDTDGLEMTWGNVEAVSKILFRIAHRQGLGNILAEGVMRAAQQIGKEAELFAIHTKKGNTPRTIDQRRAWQYMFDTCVSNTGTSEADTVLRANLLNLEKPVTPYSHKAIATLLGKSRGSMQLVDSLVVCKFTNRELPDLLTGMIRAATGWDFTWEDAMQVGLRAVNLLSAFNIRHGHKPDMVAPSPRYGSVLTDGPEKGRNIAPVWEEMMDIYYKEMGWDRATGKPLPETLMKLDLGSIVPDLWPDMQQ